MTREGSIKEGAGVDLAWAPGSPLQSLTIGKEKEEEKKEEENEPPSLQSLDPPLREREEGSFVLKVKTVTKIPNRSSFVSEKSKK